MCTGSLKLNHFTVHNNDSERRKKTKRMMHFLGVLMVRLLQDDDWIWIFVFVGPSMHPSVIIARHKTLKCT